MANASDQPRTASAMPLWHRRLLWPALVLAWASLLFWGWQAIRERLTVRVPRKDLAPLGVYDAVEGVTGPASVCLKGLGEVRLAGLAEPEASEARAALRRRLGELAPPGTPVYVEPEWPASDGGGGFASVFLHPANARADRPFPYAEAALLGAVIVQEGLARVDPAAPYRYRAEFLMLEDDARRHRRGLWAGR